MSIQTLEEIKQLFDEQHISYRHITHATIPTESQGASCIRNTAHEHGAKALILRTKSHKIIQVVLPANKRVSLKKLKKIVGEKNVSLAHPEAVKEQTDCVIGSVPPMGILWNIEVIVDQTMVAIAEVVFSAGTLEDSIFISPQELVKVNNAKVEDIIEGK